MAYPRWWKVKGPSTPSVREDERDPSPHATGSGFIDRAAATLNIAIQHVTRSGAYFSRISSNSYGVSLHRYLRGGGAILWVGNNEMFDGDGTPAQQMQALEDAIAELEAAGVQWFIVFPTMPRTNSPVDLWTTSSGQTPQSGAGPTGISADLSRKIAQYARTKNNVIVVSFPGVRSSDSSYHWKPADPRLSKEGLHPSKPGHIIMAADMVDAIGTYIGGGWPTHEANMALACPA